MSLLSSLKSRFPVVGALAAVLLVTACTENHLARRESITSEAGNAKAVNMAQTTIDTMPRSARRTAQGTDSERALKVLERYRNPPDPNASSDAESGGAVENATPSQE